MNTNANTLSTLAAVALDALSAEYARHGLTLDDDDRGMFADGVASDDLQGWADDLEARCGYDVTAFRAAILAYCDARAFVDVEANTERLAVDFVRVLANWLTPEQMEAIARKQAAPDDYCDGNMAMDEAWRALGLPQHDAASQLHADLWNAAYSSALALIVLVYA